jgi:hypothetical protein
MRIVDLHTCPIEYSYLKPVDTTSVLNPLMSVALTVSYSAFCIDVFRMIFNVNSDYFLQQR